METLDIGFYHVVIKGTNEIAYFNGNAFAIVGCTKGYLLKHFDYVGEKINFQETFYCDLQGNINKAA